MKLVNNPHLLRLHEVHETQNSLYFVVDLLEGGALFDKIRTRKSLGENEVRVIIMNIIKALRYLHHNNIMHRDIKPENLILRTQKSTTNVVFVDFGLATHIHDKNILFFRCGTPGYVAPEVLEWKDGDPLYSPKCDIFSAGVIFYLLLTGI